MKLALLTCCFLAACSFDPGGLPAGEAPDAGSDTDAGPDADAMTDGDVAPDADPGIDAAPAQATIVCTTETIDGYPKLVMTFGGDVSSGFLDAAPAGATPVALAYGSDQEDLAVINSCNGTWTVPYGSGCLKPSAAWGAAPLRLALEPEVDAMNLALLYDDGTVRWGDLKTADGDDVGFEVSGLDCRVALVNGGAGGSIRTKP